MSGRRVGTATNLGVVGTNGSGNGSGGINNSHTNGATRGGRSGTTAAAATAATTFQPKMIASQIVALQCLHYFVWTLFLQVNAVLYGNSLTIDRIFTDRYVRLWRMRGWPDALAILLAGIGGSVLLVWIVEKSKKCLDFSVTLFIGHVLLSSWYGGFPTRIEWWIVHIAATIVMIVLGEYLCSRRELDDIPLLTL